MANTISITAVNYANTASTSQTFSFQYKAYNSSTWIVASSSQSVATNGNLSAPLVIGSLTPGMLYYLRSGNNCDSPINWFVQQVQL